jgi:hypothetical protein
MYQRPPSDPALQAMSLLCPRVQDRVVSGRHTRNEEEFPMEAYLTVLISITATLGLIALGIGLVIIAPSSSQPSMHPVQKP